MGASSRPAEGIHMRRITLIVGLAVLVALVGCRGNKSDPNVPDPGDPGPPPVEWSTDMQKAAEGNNAFALDLYARLREQEKGKNAFFSPYSVHAALAMTATGAKGKTRDQMTG